MEYIEQASRTFYPSKTNSISIDIYHTFVNMLCSFKKQNIVKVTKQCSPVLESVSSLFWYVCPSLQNFPTRSSFDNRCQWLYALETATQDSDVFVVQRVCSEVG